MFAASVFIAMVKFFLCISFDLQKERTKERKNCSSVIESYFLREKIEPKIGTSHLFLFNSKYPHLSGNLAQKKKKKKKKKRKYIAFNNFFVLF